MVHWETEGFLAAQRSDVVYTGNGFKTEVPEGDGGGGCKWLWPLLGFVTGVAGVTVFSISLAMLVSSSSEGGEKSDPGLSIGLMLMGLVLVLLTFCIGLGPGQCMLMFLGKGLRP